MFSSVSNDSEVTGLLHVACQSTSSQGSAIMVSEPVVCSRQVVVARINLFKLFLFSMKLVSTNFFLSSASLKLVIDNKLTPPLLSTS